MIVADTSAIIAILRDEPGAGRFADLLIADDEALISAASYVEVAAVIDRVGDRTLSRQLDELLAAMSVRIAPVSVEQAQIARAAYAQFGRGSGHPAGLNFGDCFSYALATERGAALLFQGSDFSHTDIAAPPD